MMLKVAEVHTLYETNCRGIPDMLRQAADNVASENEDHDRTKAIVAVKVTESGGIELYGWGETDDLSALATLQLGVAQITRNILDRE